MHTAAFPVMWRALLVAICLVMGAGVTAAQTSDPADRAGETVTVNPALTLLFVHAEPSSDADIVEALTGGIAVTLTGEVETFDGETWWEVETLSDNLGWVIEVQDDIPALLQADDSPLSLTSAPVPTVQPTRTPGAPRAGDAGSPGETVVVAVDLLLLYAEPTVDAAIVEAVARDVPLDILAPSQMVDSDTWWQVRSPGGAEGWVQDTTDGLPSFVSAAVADGALARGGEAGIAANAFALIYADPDPAADVLEAATSGVLLRIIDGPELIDGVTWWQVRLTSGTQGWTPETVDGAVVLLPPSALVTPTPPPTPTQVAAQPTVVPRRTEIGIGADVQIVSLEPAWTVRASPSMRASIAGTIQRSEQATITDGPQAVSESEGGVPQDFTWWQIQTAGGVSGWIQQSYYGEPILVLYDALNPVPAVTCTLSTFRDVNIRSGPGTGYEQIASREGADQILAADGQSGDIAVPENHWWRLVDGFWIRNDQVSEQTRESCAALPLAFP
jgi:Bacterial SH3 domain/GW (Gly-Tryp) dipeptide domain